MKTKILITIITIFVLIISYLIFKTKIKSQNKLINLAVVGPMMGECHKNGEAMLKGINLFIESLNSNAMYNSKNIKLHTYDDIDKRTAVRIASQISDNNKILMVLGHYYSDNSIAAGGIYKKSGIPVITASATSNMVTFENNWYFRIVPDDQFMRNLLFSYIKKFKSNDKIKIVYYAHSSISNEIEFYKKKYGASITKQLIFSDSESSIEHELKNIAGILRSAKEPGILIFLTKELESVKMFTTLRYPGTNYEVIGTDTFSTPAFLYQFNKNKLEKKNPGYFSNGIVALSAYWGEIADYDEAIKFQSLYFQKYNKRPCWVEAAYYDAMKVALKAIISAEVKGNDIREDRKNIRNALSRINNKEIAVRGITGDIYFDKNNGSNRPLLVGYWQNQKFIPYFNQFVKKNENIEKIYNNNTNKKIDECDVKIEDVYYSVLKVIYIGLDVIDIIDIDTDNGIFNVEFYLWFRYEGDFDENNISFINSKNTITLDKPFYTETKNNITTKTYKLKGIFKYNFNKNNFPYDKHKLSINIRHSKTPRSKLILIPDKNGLQYCDDEIFFENYNIFSINKKWDVFDISYLNDILKVPVSINEYEDYSQLKVFIQIKRNNRLSILLKHYFPQIFLLIFLYFIKFIPFHRIKFNFIIILTIFLLAFKFHWLQYNYVKQYEYFQYSFYLIYFLTITSLLYFITVFFISSNSNFNKCIKFYNIYYISVILSGAGYITNLYFSF